MLQTFSLFLSRTRSSLKTLPSLFHLVLFLAVTLVAVLSLNFEVFRVIRVGDLIILIMALLIGIHWYGQKMLEAGYKEGLTRVSELSTSDTIIL